MRFLSRKISRANDLIIMIGLVVVSHSAQLAEGVAELMRGMAGPDVQIATAGGLDLPERPLGTDVNSIHRALEQVYADDGVVVLVDLGSAILSAEMAVEMFPSEQRARIVIAPAALVEGGIAAAVQARIGSDLQSVVHEARTALDAKLAQLAATISETAPSQPLPGRPSDLPTSRLVLRVRNRLGLHARPAARFVQTAAQFQCQIHLSNLSTARGPANAKSINAVATLGVLQNQEIEITANGNDAQAALDALKKLADENFGDVEQTTDDRRRTIDDRAQTIEIAGNEFIGRAASPGIAIGPARLYRPALPTIPAIRIEDASREWMRLQEAIQQAQNQLRATRDALKLRGAASEAEIFDAQILMLQDDALQEPTRRAIFEQKENGARALYDAAEHIAAAYDALSDGYQRARADDVRAVARQVLLRLLGAASVIAVERGILIVPDLTPADTAQLDPQKIQAICTAFGGQTGHSAILAKSLGIPAVVALSERILEIEEGITLIADGTAGRVFVNPDAAQLQEYNARIETERTSAANAQQARHAMAVTRDGHRVEIAANIGSAPDAARAVELGAEGVGLFRTEFLFLDRRDAPGEEEQYETYRATARALQGRPLVIRTLDIGGDKPLPYVNVSSEANPFLGLRGLRLCLARPELFKTQLRAILRAGAEFPNLRVMFPMVSTVPEFHAALAFMAQARAELRARALPHASRMETGIMVEVPSAALAAAQFARVVDFFSIGTNDLTQYTFAAERGNPNVAALLDSLQPSVLQLIRHIVDAAHAQNKWVGVCGEMGGDPRAIPLLVGLGVDELSLSLPLIPQVKEIVRGLNFQDAQLDAQRALE